MGMSQVFIAVLGGLSVSSFAMASNDPFMLWFGYGFGLAAEPFWFYAAWTTRQWGILFISCIYAVSHTYGFLNMLSGVL